MKFEVMAAAALALLSAQGLDAARAAGDRPFSLTEATRMALAKNHDIAIERESLTIASSLEEQASGVYDTVLHADLGYRDKTDPANSILAGTPLDSLGPHNTEKHASVGVTQYLPSGGSFTFSVTAARRETDNFFANLAPSYPTSVGLEFRQPLLKDRATDAGRTAIRIAQIDKTRSEASLRRTITEAVATVERAYWALVASRRDVAVRESSVAFAQNQEENTRSRIETGTLPESDIAQTTAEVERRRGELYAAEEAAVRAENELKDLILGGPDDPLWNETLIPTNDPEIAIQAVDLEAALRQAEARRPELEEARAMLSRSDVEVAAARSESQLQLDFFASYARYGLAGQDNPEPIPIIGSVAPPPDVIVGGFGRSFGTIMENRFPDFAAGLLLSFPCQNRAAKADAAIALAEKTKRSLGFSKQDQRIRVEVRNAVVAMRTAAQRIGAAKAGREAAEAILAAEKDRFAVGRSTNFLVLTRQNELSQAQLTENSAFTDYRKSQVELARATGTLLDERNIQIADLPASP